MGRDPRLSTLLRDSARSSIKTLSRVSSSRSNGGRDRQSTNAYRIRSDRSHGFGTIREGPGREPPRDLEERRVVEQGQRLERVSDLIRRVQVCTPPGASKVVKNGCGVALQKNV